MTRARLISVLVAGSMFLSMAGCCWHRPCLGHRLFPRWRATQDCCEPAACCDGGAMMTSGPIIQSGPPVMMTTPPPPTGPTPRVVPVPQTAAPIQYTP